MRKKVPILQQMISDHNLCDISRERNALQENTLEAKKSFYTMSVGLLLHPKKCNVTSCNIIPSIVTGVQRCDRALNRGLLGRLILGLRRRRYHQGRRGNGRSGY